VIETLRVLLVIELLGLAALPLAALALGRLGFGSVAFAKPIGLLLAAWLTWMATVLGVPNSTWTAAGAAALLAVAGLAALPLARRRPGLLVWRQVLVFEGVFVAAFLACALFNGFAPDVWQTEKPMDMAIVNATITSAGYPPHDPWMAGEDLNYYYFGQLAMGLLIRLGGVEPSVGYNLALAVLFALAVVTAAGLAASLARHAGCRPWLAGSAAAVLLVVAGTPGGGLDALGHGGDLAGFGWFDASRVIPQTINEFGFFSFLLGDLHAHVIAGPLTLLTLAICAQLALHGPPDGAAIWERGVAALSIGTLYAVNSWSYPVAAGLLVVALAVWCRSSDDPRRWSRATVYAGLVLNLGLLAILPFLLDFVPNAQGLGLVGRREGLGDFLAQNGALYGTFAWLLSALYVARVPRARHPLRVLVFGLATVLVTLSLLAEADLAGAGALALLLGVALHALWSGRLPGAERMVWTLVAGGLTCLLLGEFVYVRDEFDGSDLFRMNTVFKMGYQAWYLLAVAGGCAIAMAGQWLPRASRWSWGVGATVLVLLGGIYTVAGSSARKGGFAKAPTLEGRGWLPPGDVAAIDWLRENTDGDAVVLEAVGDDYSAFGHARISTYSGRPTVMGWEGHEVQWNHSPGSRREDVRRAYASADQVAVRGVLERYGVDYAVLGLLERTDYGDARGLLNVGRVVFRAPDGTAVLELPTGREEPGANRPAPVPPNLDR